MQNGIGGVWDKKGIHHSKYWVFSYGDDNTRLGCKYQGEGLSSMHIF